MEGTGKKIKNRKYSSCTNAAVTFYLYYHSNIIENFHGMRKTVKRRISQGLKLNLIWKWRVIIALNFQFKQLEGRSLKNIRASTVFEPVTSAIIFVMVISSNIIAIWMKTDFHNKDFALSLALKWRQKWTRKWPIVHPHNSSFWSEMEIG